MARGETRIFVRSERDVENHRHRMIDVLQRGFDLIVLLPAHGWASDHADYLQERVMAVLNEAVRHHELKRFHLDRVSFEFQAQE